MLMLSFLSALQAGRVVAGEDQLSRLDPAKDRPDADLEQSSEVVGAEQQAARGWSTHRHPHHDRAGDSRCRRLLRHWNAPRLPDTAQPAPGRGGDGCRWIGPPMAQRQQEADAPRCG